MAVLSQSALVERVREHAAPAPKLEAAAGARRLRRTIITHKEDGSQESREIILDQLDQVPPHSIKLAPVPQQRCRAGGM